MKVLMLTDWEYPCDESFLNEVYATRFVEQGHKIVWVMRPNSADFRDVGEPVEWNGQPVHILSETAYDPVRTMALRVTGRIDTHPVFDIARQYDVDFVQVRNDLAMGLVAARLKAAFGLPFVHRITHLKAESLSHETIEEGLRTRINARFKSVFGRRLRRWIASEADLILPISDAMRHYLINQGYESVMVPLPMGADERVQSETFDPPYVPGLDLDDGRPLLIYVGSMSPMRNLEFLFDSLVRVHEDHDVKLLMVGGRETSYRSRLEAYVEDIGIGPDVVFEPWMDKGRVRQRIVAADIGLSPIPPTIPFLNSSPTKVLEYLNLGTPAVVTDIPDQKEVIEQSGGGLVTPFDTETYARSIGSLLEDPEQRRRMGMAGQDYIRRYRSYKVLSDKIIEAYKSIGIV